MQELCKEMDSRTHHEIIFLKTFLFRRGLHEFKMIFHQI